MPRSASRFEPTVVIKTRTPDRLRIVTSVREATEALLEDWAEKKRSGAAYGDATRACLAALSGKGTAAQAHKTFVAAAKEAGNFVREEAPGKQD